DRAELLREPSDAHAEVEPPAGEPVDRRDLLRRVDRISLRHEADPGPEPDGPRARREERERDERLDRTPVPRRRDAAVRGVRIARGVVVEEDDVLGDPDRAD